MENCVVFKDGHIEPILWYDEKPSRVEVITPFGRYAYCEYIADHPSGLCKYRWYQFYRYRGFDYRRDDWVAIDSIKEFRFNKENK